MQKRKVGRPALELDMDMVIGLYKKHWSIDAIAAKTVVGDDTTLETAVIDKKQGKILPTKEDTKVDLASHVYQCKGGSLSSSCLSSKDVLMFPFECKLDNPATSIDISSLFSQYNPTKILMLKNPSFTL